MSRTLKTKWEGPLTSLTAVLALALLLRVIWALLVDVRPVSDGVVFDQLAHSLLDHGVFGLSADAPTAYRSLGPPMLYALSYALFGIGAMAIVIVNIIASLGIVAGTDWLGRRVFSPGVGRIAALLVACWPNLIQYTTVVASELPFMALMFASLAMWDRAQRDHIAWVVPASLVLVATVHFKPIALLVPMVLVTASLMRGTAQPWRLVIRGALMTALVLVALVPWALRNDHAVGSPFLTTSNFWPNMWIGNHAGADGTYTPLPKLAGANTEAARADAFRQEVLDDIEEAPGVFVSRILWKAIVFHRWETIGATWNADSLTERWGSTSVTVAKAASAGWWSLMLGLAAVGLYSGVQRHGLRGVATSTPVVLWAYFTAVHAVILVDDRLHMPIVPFVALFGAYAISQWQRATVHRWQKSSQQSSARAS